MDIATIVWQKYENSINQLARSVSAIDRARGKQKKPFEQRFKQQLQELLEDVQVKFPSRLYYNFALMVLYQESGLIDDNVAKALRSAWQQKVIEHQMQDALKDQIIAWNLSDLLNEIARPKPELDLLPLGSWFLQLDFKLVKPYISHDDGPSYIIDNPVTTDHILGLPMIRASSWKGNLRSALRLTKRWNDATPELVRLFGNPKSAEEEFRSGRLEFYPTFFYRVGLEIINPHDRVRKVGKNPILFECVPAGAEGRFSLLYVPFDLIGNSEDEIRRQAGEDLHLIAEAISAMMLTYGFSAKRTSGYGTAEDMIIRGGVRTKAGLHDLTGKKLSELTQEVKDVSFQPTAVER